VTTWGTAFKQQPTSSWRLPLPVPASRQADSELTASGTPRVTQTRQSYCQRHSQAQAATGSVRPHFCKRQRTKHHGLDSTEAR
jgi:hypothetical protein